jgi:polyphosphate kinase
MTEEYLYGTKTYINREISWLKFNERVLEEANDQTHPLLERVKFVSIFATNLDEFFMIRVSGLRRQLDAGSLIPPSDQMTPSEQLATIRRLLLPKLDEQYALWQEDLMPKLKKEGINILSYDDLKRKQRKVLRKYFKKEIFPALTPLATDPGRPFPHISNLSINLAVLVHDPVHGKRFARLKVPQLYPRLIAIPNEEAVDEMAELGLYVEDSTNFVWIEEVVRANLDLLFPGIEILAAHPFRVTRDADPEIREDEAADLLSAIEESVRERQFGSAIRLEIDSSMPDDVRDLLQKNMELDPYQIYVVDGPIGLGDLMQLMKVERPDLKDKPFIPAVPPVLQGDEDMFSVIARRNVLVYHPYDSFDPVVRFIREAAQDPKVVAIKMTLYRVGTNSPVVKTLLEARRRGKQVAVLVELKARFDEKNNILWARALERAGVHVVYGLVGLKTHSKVCLVIRKEKDGIRRYSHLGTGNYNSVSANIYTDLGYFTSNEEIGKDLSDLFNRLTGYALNEQYRKLMVAPHRMQEQFCDLVQAEIESHKKHGNGYLFFKMNALVDIKCIDALYEASQAGVKVDLHIRGICSLRPQVKGQSENIRVLSIVGRFLEHARIYYFHNNGDYKIFMGSADLMPRNLHRRVETVFPVDDEPFKTAIREKIIDIQLRDNVKAREMLESGDYVLVERKEGEEDFNSQEWSIENRGVWQHEE